MKIAIFSSWLPIISHENKILADEIGKYLAEKDITVVTGGCSGIPAVCIESAYTHNAKTIGYFPHKNEHDYYDRQHEENTHDIQYYSSAHFIHGFTARSLK
jgi:predicted Rossmann-fold nucleotide-binding protein